MGSCIDLREFQNSSDMSSIMGKLVSGRSSYKAVIERKKEIVRCDKCNLTLDEAWKFCPECGNKVK
jgi:rRNA maturation endonuclease Nob1